MKFRGEFGAVRRWAGGFRQLRLTLGGATVGAAVLACGSGLSLGDGSGGAGGSSGGRAQSAGVGGVKSGGGGEGGEGGSPDEAPEGELGSFERCPAIPAQAHILDDFERGLREVTSGQGPWISFNDGSAGTFTWQAAPAGAGEGTSLHVTATGFADFSGFGMDVGSAPTLGARCALDVRKFAGIRFRAHGTGTFRLRISTPSTLPESDGGTCQRGEDCYDQPGAFVHLDEQDQLIEIPFCGMRVQGWGSEPITLDLSQVVGFGVTISSVMQQSGFEMRMDDLGLYTAQDAVYEPNCQAGCPLMSAPTLDNILPDSSYLLPSKSLSVSTFEQATRSCGTITRRYLSYVPELLSKSLDAPVVILLHGFGANAESVIETQTHGRLNELAEESGFIAVYGNAAPGWASSSDPRFTNTGAWRQASSDDREVDDVQYLREVVSDLKKREIISGKNPLFLAGVSNGGGMTLKAAHELSHELSAIAAFMPFMGTSPSPVPDLKDARLTHVMLMQSEGDPGLPPEHDQLIPQEVALWVEALGLSQDLAREMDLPNLVEEGQDYEGTNVKVLRTRSNQVEESDYASETTHRKLVSFRIVRGGHFLPSRTADTDPQINETWGLRNQDVDASEVMWSFFQSRLTE